MNDLKTKHDPVIEPDKPALNVSNADNDIQRRNAAPFVLSVTDNEDNELKIILALAKTERAEVPDGDNSGLREILENAVEVQPDEGNLYEVVFERYIIYQCRNESYTAFDETEVRNGRYLVTFEKSRLLDYYDSVIFDFDDEETKQGRKHYGIYACDHVIDVISNDPPKIRKIISD